jgi:DNA-binding NtrC family response regulator
MRVQHRFKKNNPELIKKIYGERESKNKNVEFFTPNSKPQNERAATSTNQYDYAETVIEEEPLSLLEKEIEMIKHALKRSHGKRKMAAKELGISERTLYRKIKQFDLHDDDSA